MSEWIRIRVKDFYKDAVGELEYMNITVRRSRQSGVARATCPD